MSGPQVPRSARNARARAVRVALIVLVLGLVAAAEIGARRVAPSVGTLTLFRPATDPRMCFEPVPGAHGSLEVPGLPPTPVAFDARGIRGNGNPAFPHDARLHIVMLGPGIVFGLGVGPGDTLAAALEEQLRARGFPADVVNLGVPSYRPSQWQARFEALEADLRPDLVLVASGDGDFEASDCLLYDAPAWFRNGLMPVSALVRLAAYAWNEHGRWEQGTPYRRGPGLRGAVAAMRALRDRMAARGGRVATFVVARDPAVTPQALSAFSAMGVPVLDAVSIGPANRSDPFYVTRFGNYSGRGARVVAGRLADWLIEQRVLRPRGSTVGPAPSPPGQRHGASERT